MEKQTNASTDLVSDERRELRHREVLEEEIIKKSPLYYFESQT